LALGLFIRVMTMMTMMLPIPIPVIVIVIAVSEQVGTAVAARAMRDDDGILVQAAHPGSSQPSGYALEE